MKGNESGQIYCFLDCLAYAADRVDCRPLYFGIWDAPFSYSEQEGFTYYSDKLIVRDLFDRFELLYGQPVETWYDYGASRTANFLRLEQQVSERDGQAIIVMADLFYLPHSVRFGKEHFPHFLLVDRRTNDGRWRLIDPYLGWSGSVSRETMRSGFGCLDMNTGVSIRPDLLRQPDARSISEAFESGFGMDGSPLTSEIKRYGERLAEGSVKLAPKQLQAQLEQAKTLVKRKRGYRVSAQFFADRLNEPLAEDRSAELEKLWDGLMLMLFRLGISGRAGDPGAFYAKIALIDNTERRIKQELWHRYERWRERYVE